MKTNYTIQPKVKSIDLTAKTKLHLYEKQNY